MSIELTLSYTDVAELERDFESNLCKGRAFVAGAWGLAEREFCTLRIEHPGGGAPLCLEAEAVWVDEDPASGGTGVQLVSFGGELRQALKAFVGAPSPTPSSEMSAVSPSRAGPDASEAYWQADAAEGDAAPGDSAEETSSARHLHDRIRALSLAERELVARQGSLPERVALERRFGGSVWEGLLHNPQLTSREVLRMAKSPSLPTHLVNLIVANKAWLADGAIQTALLHNPRVSGAHLDRVLRGLPQAELVRLSQQSSLRMQVRQGAKRLIRR